MSVSAKILVLIIFSRLSPLIIHNLSFESGSNLGRDYYGCFPLKGKLLNVRDAAHKVIMSNEEIKNLVDIIGLKFNQKYDKENIKSLRYGHVMIMADQDSDGSHIVGLLINFIHRECFDQILKFLY